MIPYLHAQTLHIGPITVQPYGTLVALGTLVLMLVAARRAKLLGLRRSTPFIFTPAVLFGGMVVGHIVSAVVYFPERLVGHPWYIMSFFSGIALHGAVLGGAAAMAVVVWARGESPLRYADPLAYGAVMGLAVGRLGCALVHDHPGRVSDFVLAVRGWPLDGLTRHDVGLYEWFVMLALAALLLALQRVRPFPGFHAALVLGLYALARFLLDFLRVGERHYGPLAGGQWLSLVMLACAVGLALYGLRRGARAAAA